MTAAEELSALLNVDDWLGSDAAAATVRRTRCTGVCHMRR
jgi:hypothetical protein